MRIVVQYGLRRAINLSEVHLHHPKKKKRKIEAHYSKMLRLHDSSIQLQITTLTIIWSSQGMFM